MSLCLSVCPSVSVSVSQTRELWQNVWNMYLWSLSSKIDASSFPIRKIVGGVVPCALNFARKLTPHFKKTAITNLASIASAVTISGKSSSMTHKKSTTRFPVSLRWTAYVTHKPLKETPETKSCRFSSKMDFSRRTSAIEFFMWKLSTARL